MHRSLLIGAVLIGVTLAVSYSPRFGFASRHVARRAPEVEAPQEPHQHPEISHRYTIESIATMSSVLPDGTPGEFVLERHDAFADAAAIALDRRFNPEQRLLDSAAFARLSTLIEDANRELAELQRVLADEQRAILARKLAAGEVERAERELELSAASDGSRAVVVVGHDDSPSVIHLDAAEAERVDSLNTEIQARFEDAARRIQALFS